MDVRIATTSALGCSGLCGGLQMLLVTYRAWWLRARLIEECRCRSLPGTVESVAFFASFVGEHAWLASCKTLAKKKAELKP